MKAGFIIHRKEIFWAVNYNFTRAQTKILKINDYIVKHKYFKKSEKS